MTELMGYLAVPSGLQGFAAGTPALVALWLLAYVLRRREDGAKAVSIRIPHA